MQSTSNGVLFKEEQMMPYNPFVETNHPLLVKFYEKLSVCIFTK